jgi:hypothetical protein
MRIALSVLIMIAACSGPSTPPVSDPPPSAPPAPAESESIGGIALGDPAAEVEAAFGAPASKGEVVEWEATGDRTATWTWSEGLKLEMAETTDGAPPIVHSMHMEAPSKRTTSRGVGIGTPYAEVDRIYAPFRGQGREEGEPEVWGPESIIVGSVYGGTFFTFEGGAVSSVFVGAGAE